MIIMTQAKDFELTQALHEHVESKLRLMLGRYEQKIMRVQVMLFDVNGPRGGEDMCCKLIIQVPHASPIVIKEVTSDMYESINICAHRAKRVLGRNIAHMQKNHRQAG